MGLGLGLGLGFGSGLGLGLGLERRGGGRVWQCVLHLWHALPREC